MEIMENLPPSPRGNRTPTLSLRGAWKLFGHVTALQDASLDAYEGEILAIVGDNGAGKSTLVKALVGAVQLDRGEIWVNRQIVSQTDPRSMRRAGLSVVFQDLALVETLDVATNMFLGQPLKRAGFLKKRAMWEAAASTLRELEVRIPSVRIAIGDLSGGQRQSVAIARAVLEKNPILLLDEPTAALGVRETAQVKSIIESLRSSGIAVIMVSHDLEFVFGLADQIQVMRLGRVEAVLRATETTRANVVSLITGLATDSKDTGSRP